MFRCITGSRYNMTADIYTSSSIVDEVTGISVKTYSYNDTINCFARGVVRTGISDNSTTKQRQSDIVNTDEIVKLRYGSAINTGNIIANIKNSAGVVVWSEDDEDGSSGGISGATIFEVIGNTPIMDSLGSIVEYEIVIKRLEIQKVKLSA